MFACFVILSFTGETINECLLVLHTAATGVCQLYLALLHLRRAGQHFVIAWHIDYTADCINENVLWYGTQSEHILKPRRKGAAAVHFLEGACLLWESLSLFLAVVSTVCVAVRHVLQAALFLIISTVRWPQKMLLSKEDLDEWEKEQKKERKELQEQRQQVEKYLTVVEHFPSLHKTKRSWLLLPLKIEHSWRFLKGISSPQNVASGAIRALHEEHTTSWTWEDQSVWMNPFKTVL